MSKTKTSKSSKLALKLKDPSRRHGIHVGLFQSTKKIPNGDLVNFFRQFSTMISAGVPIFESVKTIAAGENHPALAITLGRVTKYLVRGMTLAASMERTKTFEPSVLAMVHAAEVSGTLEKTLDQVSTQMEKMQKIRKQVISSMMYPGFMMLFCFSIVILMLAFVVPQFQQVFSSNGAELPALTQALVNISNALRKYWYLIPTPFMAMYILFKQFEQNPSFRKWWERTSLEIWVLGPILKKFAVAKFTRTFSAMQKAGVDVIQSIRVSSDVVNHHIYAEIFEACIKDVEKGKKIADSLDKYELLPAYLITMISIGEASGTLDFVIAKVADVYENDVENALKAATSLVEPLLIAVMGILIGTIVVGMYLPVFKMGQIMGG